jgi:outer membrane protein TolC
MSLKDRYKFILFMFVGPIQGCSSEVALAAEKLDKPLVRIEQRLEEETRTRPSEPNSLTFMKATGQVPYRTAPPRQMEVKRLLTLNQCLQLAFANDNEIETARQRIIAVGGTKLITNSRFLPTIELISQYEHFSDLGPAGADSDAYGMRAEISRRILEYGKDSPLDVSLRAEQRNALFNYERQVAITFSEVRRAFFFIELKERQIAIRQQLLEGFRKQYERKRRRMEEGNLSVKIEVLTARLNVLEEESQINSLTREQFNRKMDLLRLIGLPVGADKVDFEGEMDRFGLDTFDIDWAINLALAQSSEVAFAQAIVAEQRRLLNQLRYEYIPDLRFSTGYQDDNGRIGAGLTNESDTWGLDVVGQPQTFDRDKGPTLGLFGSGRGLSGPDPGWFAGVQLRIPVFEGNSRKGLRMEAQAALDSARTELDKQVDEVELSVRQDHKILVEQEFQVELEQERGKIAKERLSIKEELRAIGKITDDELETFRNQFFSAQDNLFRRQEVLVGRQEDLRLSIRYFK